MQLYPAIDLRGGKCVRLRQGSFQDMKTYSDSPAETALHWQSQGATFLHLVDLDGAQSGSTANEAAIRSIRSALHIPIELGGGIRTAEAAERLLTLGIDRVIIGTRAAADPGFMKALVKKFGAEHVVAGIDAKNGMVAVEGWEKLSSVTALELCMTMQDCGVRHIVYTDIARDGMLSGPNIDMTAALTKKTGLDVIASGGVSSLADLSALRDAGVKGAIIGKALYEGKIDLSEAVRSFQ